MNEQIAAVRAALAAVEAALVQTEAALRTAADPQDVMALTSALIDLRAQRSALQLQLANLEAAAVVVQPLGAARPASRGQLESVGEDEDEDAAGMRSLQKDLHAAVTDRRVSVATIAFATEVLAKAKAVRSIAGTGGPPNRAPREKEAGARSKKKTAFRRRRGK